MEVLKPIDLTQKHPQVLLVGNGLTRSTGYSWHDFINNCAKDKIDIEKYKKDNVFQIPNTILSLTVMETDDVQRHRRYIENLNKINYISNPHIDKLVKLPVDSILTTNYTYEIEYAIRDNYPDLTDNSKKKYAVAIKSDAKYLVHTYNAFNEFPPIWHIHGEARRKSSLILSHDEYARLTNKIIEYCNKRKDDYSIYNRDIHVKSWIDYFILGDLYILGFGFDFAEFDLWWLINRRIREKETKGKIYFYEPKTKDNKYKLLAMEDMGIKVESLGIEIEEKDENADRKYNDFYNKAIDDIANKMGVKHNGNIKM